MSTTRTIASVLLSAEEGRRLNRLARGRPPGTVLLSLVERDVQAHGAVPAVISAGAARPVSRKLSVAIPESLIESVDARRGTASYGAYLRSLLGIDRESAETVPAAQRVICRAARPLPAGRLDELALGNDDATALVQLVPDVEELAEQWTESFWNYLGPGEIGWVLLGLFEARGPGAFTTRAEGEVAFGALRGLFRDSGSNARIVLRPSFVFRKYVRGRRVGESRWVECEERECDGVVVAVKVEAFPLAVRGALTS